MDRTCGYYHPEKGDQRIIQHPEQVFDSSLMRARPLPYKNQGELTQNWQEVVMDNPNHIKEFLYNQRLSTLRADQLQPILRTQFGLDEDVVNCLSERGTV